jgi:cell division protein FtsN
MLIFPGLISNAQFDPPANPELVSVNPDLVIQVGAFRKEPNALVLKDKLSAVLNKSVFLVTEDGYTKVRLTGFSSLEEIEKLYPTLSFLGLKDIWVLPGRKVEETDLQASVQPDTTRKQEIENAVIPAISEDIPDESESTYTLQVEVFHNKSKAMNARKKIKTELNLPVEIVQEWEYYKVIVPGFETTDDAIKCSSTIANLGYPDITLIKNFRKK